MLHVNWDATFAYTNPVSRALPACRVAFKNGAFFDSLEGVPFNCFCADAAFTGRYMSRSAAAWKPFEGVVSNRWEDLAKNLEIRICRELGLPTSIFEESKPTRILMSAKLGETGLARTLIYWRKLPPLAHGSQAEKTEHSILAAEFDLRTGELKLIDFHNPNLVSRIEAALKETN